MTNTATLKKEYTQTVVPKLKEELGIGNVMALPKIEKVIVNVGVGRHTKEEKYIQSVVADVAKITGQKPVRTLAKKSIAGFKIREGNVVGVKVTLRGNRMYEFLEKLTRVALPRIRDFKGIPTNSFDPQGNYSLGLREQTVFPEILPDQTTAIFPLEITIVTSAENKEQGRKLLDHLGFPFKKD